jgi:hypothetical protein
VGSEMTRFLGGLAIAHYTARRFEEGVKYMRENWSERLMVSKLWQPHIVAWSIPVARGSDGAFNILLQHQPLTDE